MAAFLRGAFQSRYQRRSSAFSQRARLHTIACIPRLADDGLGVIKVDEVRPDTAEKIRRVRAALEALE